MDHKSIFEQFKKQYVEPGDVFCLSLIPILFLQLRAYGATKGVITEGFIKDFSEILLPDEKTAVLSFAVDDILLYRDSILREGPAATAYNNEPIKKEAKQQEIITQLISKNSDKALIEDSKSLLLTNQPSSSRNVINQAGDIGIKGDIEEFYVPEEEGDPLHTPEDQMIDLNPEDCADAVTDLDFLKRIEAIGNKQ